MDERMHARCIEVYVREHRRMTASVPTRYTAVWYGLVCSLLRPVSSLRPRRVVTPEVIVCQAPMDYHECHSTHGTSLA